jgi:phage-related protein
VPRTQVLFYRDEDGTVPLLDWLDQIADAARDKCVAKLRRLHELGHELRRPEADLLRDGIYELRVGLRGMNYRILYFFHGNVAAVVSHGLTKERVVPPVEIDRALRRKQQFLKSPARHTAEMPNG